MIDGLNTMLYYTQAKLSNNNPSPLLISPYKIYPCVYSCCQIPGSCQCDPTRCNNVACPPKHTRKLQSAAENTPGKCCDMYECLPGF